MNMLSLSGPFESTGIQAGDLAGLERRKLAGMGIKEDFPQQAILVCISELCRSRGIVSMLFRKHRIPVAMPSETVANSFIKGQSGLASIYPLTHNFNITGPLNVRS